MSTLESLPIELVEQFKLVHGDPVSQDHFGTSVALSSDGNIALIGTYGKNGYRGAAYVFAQEGSTWTQQAKLTHSDPAANDYFGQAVSLSSDGKTVLIGANNKTESGRSQQGAVYIFIRSGSTWTQQGKLTHSDPAASDWFGHSVALSSDGGTALIGTPYKTESDLNSLGAAYIFHTQP